MLDVFHLEPFCSGINLYFEIISIVFDLHISFMIQCNYFSNGLVPAGQKVRRNLKSDTHISHFLVFVLGLK